ncbi:SMI1/KNR4 family protein [Lysinibacillus antri]|uniref:SMI1/KNR4 family protein n=1 Tax=Lysinibacillus antri TaxID=2498145 RepID=A0A3S0R708_9BACI|nr:SMI1/KNR4 family protein [Lysinibacillus antri]RUL54064.1 SMI1/KNR4 family protein [Lysinibacillus antri]
MSIFTGEYFDNYRLEDLSSEIIELAEGKLKVKLPTAYIELMNEQNGGELTLKKFVHNIFEDGFIEIDYLYGIGQKSGEGILIDSYTRKEWGLSNKFIYLHGDSHNWIALDYRRYTGDNPPVVYIDTDTKQKLKIAEDFTEFISKLSELEGEIQSYDMSSEYEEFSREEIEKALLGGWHKYHMTAGLHYFGLLDEDLNWFLTQMLGSIKRLMEKQFFEDHSTIDNYLNIIIDIIRKKKVDFNQYAQTEELFEILTNFPKTMDYNSMIRNKSIKIKNYLTIEQNR